MDNKQRLQDLKDDCCSVGWDGYIPAIEALEFENAALKAALRAELAARGPVLSMEDFDVVDAAMDYVDAAAEEAAKECTSERDLNMAKSIADDLRNLLERAKR